MSDEADVSRLARGVPVLLALFLALAALAGPMWLFLRDDAQAAFSDQESFGTNFLGAGELDLAVGARTTELTAANMAPGDMAIGWLDLANNGTLHLRYALEIDLSADPLSSALTWQVWGAASCGALPAGFELLTDRSLTAGAAQPLLGRAETGADPGDRRLAPGDNERLCIAATLPIDADDSLQGRNAVATIHVLAEHDLDREPTP